MYAVIRAGGKQYRVSPGDVIKIEKTASEKGQLEFTDVLAVSPDAGKIRKPQGDGAKVLGTVLEEGRGDKVLVFHFKRKKQYKKLQGHRQPFTAVRISEISFDGQSFKAEPLRLQLKKQRGDKIVEAKSASSRAAAQKIGAETAEVKPAAKAVRSKASPKAKKSSKKKG